MSGPSCKQTSSQLNIQFKAKLYLSWIKLKYIEAKRCFKRMKLFIKQSNALFMYLKSLGGNVYLITDMERKRYLRQISRQGNFLQRNVSLRRRWHHHGGAGRSLALSKRRNTRPGVLWYCTLHMDWHLSSAEGIPPRRFWHIMLVSAVIKHGLLANGRHCGRFGWETSVKMRKILLFTTITLKIKASARIFYNSLLVHQIPN